MIDETGQFYGIYDIEPISLTDLLAVQNDFLSVWINQETIRRSLDFDIGTMQLAPDGVWIDPGPLVANTPDESIEAMELEDAVPVEDVLDDGLLPQVEPDIEGARIDPSYPLGTAPVQRATFTIPVRAATDFSSPVGSLRPSAVFKDIPRRLPGVVPETLAMPASD